MSSKGRYCKLRMNTKVTNVLLVSHKKQFNRQNMNINSCKLNLATIFPDATICKLIVNILFQHTDWKQPNISSPIHKFHHADCSLYSFFYVQLTPLFVFYRQGRWRGWVVSQMLCFYLSLPGNFFKSLLNIDLGLGTFWHGLGYHDFTNLKCKCMITLHTYSSQQFQD